MSRLCGWAGRVKAEQPRAVIDAMAVACAVDGAAGIQAALAPEAALAVQNGSVFEGDGVLAAVCGHPIFSGKRFAAVARERGAAAAIAAAHAEKGADAIRLLRGDFAVVVLDHRRNEALLAVDRMGVHSLTYAITGSGLVFGSVADALNRHPAVSAELDPQALYHYVYFHMVPGPDTVYRGQRRLLPGHLLSYAGGKAETQAWWHMEFAENVRQPFAELREGFLGSLRDAVRLSTGGARVGAFLSGGTDSSTIAGMLGEVTGEPARTFSIGFEAEGYDEMAYARIAANHFKTRHHEYYVTPADVVEAIPRIAALYDQPFGNASAMPTYYCARLAKSHGIERLLGGDGGDELFGGNERYATQHLYSLYERIPGPLRRFVLEPVVQAFPGGDSIAFVRKTRSYIRQAHVPMPERTQSYNIVERFGAQRMFTAEFLAGIDRARPLALLDDVYRNARAGSMINRMLALDRQFTLADNDLPKVTRTCELAGVDVAFPMLDDPVIDFSTRLEPRLKLKGTRLRYFFKEALRGFLPEAIITKTKHGFGLPFGPWLKQHKPLQDIVYGNLADLRKRGIVHADFLDELTGVRIGEHAAYYGAIIWVLMMLEQWLKQHRTGT